MKKFLLLMLISSIPVLHSQSFKPVCALPFEKIKVKHDIDATCPNTGVPTAKNAKANATQNKIKNNFCADGSKPREIKINELVALYEKVKAEGISFGTSMTVPEDRTALQKLGEGTVVTFTGYINKVDYSNVGKGETVNCKTKGKEYNDIHMELTETKEEEDICRRISAEIIPHFRPKFWELGTLNSVKDGNIKIKITGQLFFDASHTACGSEGKGTRASSWEIHPVYGIQIYVNKKWVDLDEIAWEDEDE